jgi:hypothetical protein
MECSWYTTTDNPSSISVRRWLEPFHEDDEFDEYNEDEIDDMDFEDPYFLDIEDLDDEDDLQEGSFDEDLNVVDDFETTDISR